jgi:hypothetical protein
VKSDTVLKTTSNPLVANRIIERLQVVRTLGRSGTDVLFGGLWYLPEEVLKHQDDEESDHSLGDNPRIVVHPVANLREDGFRSLAEQKHAE